jgi:GxxExxY protein
MTEREINALCDKVRQTAYEIHVYLGPGHLEKVYENALFHRLRKAGVEVKQQYPLNVYDQDGTLLGEYSRIYWWKVPWIVEAKAAKLLAVEHDAQVLGYLRSGVIEHGLLMNFGAPKFQIRKFAWSRQGRNPTT